MKILRTRKFASLLIASALTAQGAVPAAYAAHPEDPAAPETATPIKHLIVIIGENRTFDNVYGTYTPKHGHVANLLSRGIVEEDGSPGPNHALARQFQIATIDPVAYFVSTTKLNDPQKTAYSLLPTPEAGGAPPLPVTLAQIQHDPAPAFPPVDAHTFSRVQLHTLSPVLVDKKDLHLLTTGATGLSNCAPDSTEPPAACAEPDTRIEDFMSLTNTVFQITGPKLPYDSYTGDMVHRFFHMWQQSDCDVANKTASNPTGCLNDLYPYVGIARGDDSGGNSMGFYNVRSGDAPLFKKLADEYTMSDNYHQPVMGGTAVQHIMLGTGDAIFWEQVGNLPAEPPAAQVANPNPKSSTNDAYVTDRRWTKCGDSTAPGIAAIQNYLKSLPWHPDKTPSNCEPNRFYMINNTRPGFLSNGELNTGAIQAGSAVPPSSLRTIGDALNEKNISWAFYGGGFDAARGASTKARRILSTS
jgi:phospholipase C